MNFKLLIFIVFGFLLIGGLYFVFKPKTTNDISPQSKIATTSAIPTAMVEKVFTLKIQNQKLVSGSSTITVSQGDQVTIQISGDQAEELHLHGYDKSVEYEAGKTGELKFIADLSGRFPFELEKSKTDIGVLEVLPK